MIKRTIYNVIASNDGYTERVVATYEVLAVAQESLAGNERIEEVEEYRCEECDRWDCDINHYDDDEIYAEMREEMDAVHPSQWA